MKKNIAGQFIGCQLISKTDGSAVTTGTTTVYVTGDAGIQAAGSVGAGACTHEGNGYWTYAPAQAETNYDQIAFTFVNTAACNATLQVYPTFPQGGDNFARLGAPAGASIAADLLAIDNFVDGLETTIGIAGAGLTALGDTRIANLDALISTRATPTNITSATGVVLSGVTHTGAVIPTVTAVTNDVGITQVGADKAWGAASRILTAGTNIILAKGTGVTGFNDLDAAGVAAAVLNAATATYGTAGSYGLLFKTNLDATVTSRMATYTQPTGFLAASFPLDPADQSLIIAATDAIKADTAAILVDTGTTLDARIPAALVGGRMDSSVGVITAGERTALAGVVLTTTPAESYRVDGAVPTIAQGLCETLAHLGESSITGTTKTIKKVDGITAAATFTLDSATTPTSITRAT